MNTYRNMIGMITEPGSRAEQAVLRMHKLGICQKPGHPRSGSGKARQLLFRGAPRGGWETGILRAHPQGTVQKGGAGWSLGEAAGQEKP